MEKLSNGRGLTGPALILHLSVPPSRTRRHGIQRAIAHQRRGSIDSVENKKRLSDHFDEECVEKSLRLSRHGYDNGLTARGRVVEGNLRAR